MDRQEPLVGSGDAITHGPRKFAPLLKVPLRIGSALTVKIDGPDMEQQQHFIVPINATCPQKVRGVPELLQSVVEFALVFERQPNIHPKARVQPRNVEPLDQRPGLRQ